MDGSLIDLIILIVAIVLIMKLWKVILGLAVFVATIVAVYVVGYMALAILIAGLA